MINLRQLTYGILSYFPFVPKSLYQGTGGTNSAEYCYCVWLSHLALAKAGGMAGVPSTLAELGPGDSIGVGLAALISGVEHYIALDVIEHVDKERNLDIFDNLVRLFQQNAAITYNPFSGKRASSTFSSLSDLLEEQELAAALAPQRIANLRAQILEPTRRDGAISYRVPWTFIEQPDQGSVDMILSNAVMEHVEDVPDAYRAMYGWLKPFAYASHQIDFRCHSLFTHWDGHWACPDWLWTLFMGRRSYLINRLPYSTHRREAERAGFVIKSSAETLNKPCSHRLARRFRNLSMCDRQIASAYLLMQKDCHLPT